MKNDGEPDKDQPKETSTTPEPNLEHVSDEAATETHESHSPVTASDAQTMDKRTSPDAPFVQSQGSSTETGTDLETPDAKDGDIGSIPKASDGNEAPKSDNTQHPAKLQIEDISESDLGLSHVAEEPAPATPTSPISESSPKSPQGISNILSNHSRDTSQRNFDGHRSKPSNASATGTTNADGPAVSEWSHQQLAPQKERGDVQEEEEEETWQEMPAFAQYNMYDDDGRLVAKEMPAGFDDSGYGNIGGAAKGYTKVQLDDDAQSATSMDENTAYLFKNSGYQTQTLQDEEEDQRDPLAQMQATKDLLTDNQRIAYVGVVRLAMADMLKEFHSMEKTKGAKKEIEINTEALIMWTQKMMVRLYSHMDVESAEQIMIEQLADHGLQATDLTPTLMQNARVKNPVAEEDDGPEDDAPDGTSSQAAEVSKKFEATADADDAARDDTPPSYAAELPSKQGKSSDSSSFHSAGESLDPPPYEAHVGEDFPEARSPSHLPHTSNIDIDIRWTVLCDLFLVFIADSVYDARSRTLLERVAAFLDVSSTDICRFEKRVVDALEMQEEASQETWNEQAHMEHRRKMARRRRFMMMGLATVGGGLVIGLSAGLLAPVIGAGLAAGFTTIGVSGTTTFLTGAGGIALVTTTGLVTGSTIGVRASNRRMGSVKTFEYRPLHNNKRVNLIITVSGWMNGKVDDVRLPYSTVDPIMGDMYAVHWEPEMLTSMGDTINILATEALTQGLQQILGSTILIGLMAALQLPIVLTKLSYLIDNPWSVSLARADQAGLILADSLMDRNLGLRPVTLVGFSIGARVIFSALRELASKGAVGLIQNVYVFGTPQVFKKDDYLRAKAIVSGRFVNGYATTDWILGYLFRATGGGISQVAGLAKVDIPGIENFDCTEEVPGHMSYRAAMPKLMRKVGWIVTSDEFSEIEDPDPENHERRQRELINEIEEARKELEQKPEKKRFGIFKPSKKKAEKKVWETYDDRMKGMVEDDPSKNDTPGGQLFDIEAIRAEVAELAAEGIHIKELESTMPAMKLNLDYGFLTNGHLASRSAPMLAYSKNSDGSGNHERRNSLSPSRSLNSARYNESYDTHSPTEENISMSLASSHQTSLDYLQASRSKTRSREPSPEPAREAESPVLQSSSFGSQSRSTQPDLRGGSNVWADEEELRGEGEMELTFA